MYTVYFYLYFIVYTIFVQIEVLKILVKFYLSLIEWFVFTDTKRS